MAMTKTGEPLDLSAPIATDTPGWVTDFAGNSRKINDFARATSNKIGDITALQTEFKDNLVGAVNEVINTIPDLGGTNILNATNELVTIGASASWLGRSWRYGKSGATPNATGTQAVFAVSDAPNPQIKYGFEIHNDSGRRFVTQDNIPLATGTTYTLSCYARATAGSPKLVLQTGGNAGGYNTSVVEITDGWKKYTMTFTARADTESAYFGCDGADVTLQICGEKLETGDYATDWSYSPNDIDAANSEKLDKSKVVNGLLTTEEGFALDARQGKALDEKIAELNSNLAGLIIKNTATNKVNVSAGAQSYTYITISLPAGYSVLSISAVAAHSTTLCGTASISGDRVYIPYVTTAAQTPETFSAEIVLLKTL
ncbi:phage head spike fiber domain-containing protein [Extibacter muris]|uniref:CBM-cenC domain-containing protein n=1 Tax=Extibacter muris TaxID=1796622 RepID=A0A4R4FGE7_9FIRM|nr:carbohydrate binding domain-containing protein [Extibacter muris]MCU0079348.1 carbohydrate binding domain-containing protein [Extibacter muris]TDA21929.1 hypothetical protein E1963_09215 [Extibacter muris]